MAKRKYGAERHHRKEGGGEMSIDYYSLSSVCMDCARNAGFRQKPKMVGVWMARCEVCGEMKPTCDLVHDYWPPEIGEEGGEGK